MVVVVAALVGWSVRRRWVLAAPPALCVAYLLGVAYLDVDPDLPIVFVCAVAELGLVVGWAWSGRHSEPKRPA